MLSDEEKQAIQYYKECNEKDLENYEYLGDVSKKQAKYLELLLNLIKKQSKEIEELKDKAKELIFEKQELTSALLDSTPDDKIKAKIEEVDKDENASIPDFIEYAKEYATQKLQSLLEKEG